MKQIFELDQISFVKVSECLVNDYLIMVNDEEHVGKYIHGRIGGFQEYDRTDQHICMEIKR